MSDYATSFKSEEFQILCKSKEIVHPREALYHLVINGKKILPRPSLPSKAELQEFLKQYKRTPLSCVFSPNEPLNRRKIRTEIDSLLPNTTTAGN